MMVKTCDDVTRDVKVGIKAFARANKIFIEKDTVLYSDWNQGRFSTSKSILNLSNPFEFSHVNDVQKHTASCILYFLSKYCEDIMSSNKSGLSGSRTSV